LKLARIAYSGPDGVIPRLVVAQPEQQQVIDLLTAERKRLERQGAAREAALRLATALFPPSMAAAIALGDAFLTAAAQAVQSADDEAILPLADVHLLSPLDPPLLRDFSAFLAHIRAMTQRMGQTFHDDLLRVPFYYKGNPSTIIAPEQEVRWPSYTQVMDYELELGFVIGKPAENLTQLNALEHLFGVTILNDFSARDVQGPEMRTGFGPAKGKDFATALGPWIVTRDELDLEGLTMVARVNGEEWSHGSSASMTWSIAELIAYASWGETLQPGELLGSGTVGTGAGAEHGKQLQPGDVVELEVSGIGVLRNCIGQPEPRVWTPQPRPAQNNDIVTHEEDGRSS
jgi:2-keto-4-pentenoate hydratase/2-oxohepta-3-ene-1,7-dioic acid hydratase in catechol pathway